MNPSTPLGARNETWNTVLAWMFVALLLLVGLVNAVRGDVLWAVFTAATLVIVLLPNTVEQEKTFLLPWELLFVAALPLAGRALGSGVLTHQATTTFGVAGAALIIAVELDMLTTVRMPSWFAVIFTVIATLATAGVWSIVLWLSDVFRGTFFLSSNEVLMHGFLWTAVVGVAAGTVFDQYFRRLKRWRT